MPHYEQRVSKSSVSGSEPGESGTVVLWGMKFTFLKTGGREHFRWRAAAPEPLNKSSV